MSSDIDGKGYCVPPLPRQRRVPVDVAQLIADGDPAPVEPEIVALAEAIGRALARLHHAEEQRAAAARREAESGGDDANGLGGRLRKQ
jgi:hypothetical protein